MRKTLSGGSTAFTAAPGVGFAAICVCVCVRVQDGLEVAHAKKLHIHCLCLDSFSPQAFAHLETHLVAHSLDSRGCCGQ